MNIQGKRQYLSRAVDQDGEVVHVFLQKRRDGKAAKRFSKRLLNRHQSEPRKIVMDKLRSYGVAHRELIPDTIHDTSQYADNRAELSHQPTRVRGRGMRRFKSPLQTQRFLSVHAAVYNLFSLGRNPLPAKHYRLFRQRAFASWKYATAPLNIWLGRFLPVESPSPDRPLPGRHRPGNPKKSNTVHQIKRR